MKTPNTSIDATSAAMGIASASAAFFTPCR
jgi:hypothetical protein